MFLSYLNQFPIENVSLNIIPLLCVVFCMAESFFLCVLLNRVGRFHKFLLRCQSFVESQLGIFDDLKAQGVKKNQDFELPKQLPCSTEKIEEDGNLCREDVEIVMTRLGIFCHPEDEKLQERLSSDELSNLFEEKEPSLDEVKGAFDVFDENRDGFIDAKELQRVLCVLGFKAGLEMENCRRMIAVFDENGDGRIDFSEFVKFMENTFC